MTRLIRALLPAVVAALLSSYPSSAPAQQSGALFDGVSLEGWTVVGGAGSGEVVVRDGAIVLERGEPLTGIVWAGDFPRIDYEVTLQAMRVEGSDFFSAITFPVAEAFATLVIGGWGGGVVGLSSLEGADASENETRRYLAVEDGRWYPVRLRVTQERIEVWIDGEQFVDLPHQDRLLSVRLEMLANRPFGIASWMTTGAIRDVKVKELGRTTSDLRPRR